MDLDAQLSQDIQVDANNQAVRNNDDDSKDDEGKTS